MSRRSNRSSRKFWAELSGTRKTVLIALLGLTIGLFGYFILLSEPLSYLSGQSEMCVSCHVMEAQYSTWNHSSHRRMTTCAECHLPQDHPVKMWAVKTRDGFKDFFLFMFRGESNIPHSTRSTRQVVMKNCRRCHSDLMAEINLGEGPTKSHGNRLCWECHRDVPHGRVRGLASISQPLIQSKLSPVPTWLQEKLPGGRHE